MKKVVLFIICTIGLMAHAQTPVNRSMAIVQKATATWCTPCGLWGWTLQDEIAADNGSGTLPHAFVFALHGPGSNYETGAGDTLTLWTRSWPSWALNNINRSVHDSLGITDTGATRASLKKAVDSFAAIEPTASTGFSFNINKDTITFNTTTRFWKGAAGTYNLAVYVIEDSVWGSQGGHLSLVYHRNILRGSINGMVYGEPLASGNIFSNTTYTRNYRYIVPDATWNKSRLKFVTVIWKKDGNNWQFENSNSIQSSPTVIGKLPEAADQLIISPNPASSRLHISGILNAASGNQIIIANMLGQTVWEKALPYNGGQLSENIRLDDLTNGVYTLILKGVSGQNTQKLIVAH